MKTNIAVLISGSGTNLQSIIDKAENNELPVNIACVISNNKKAFGLSRARNHNIPAYCINHKNFADRTQHEQAIIDILHKYKVELIVLAGYMRLLTSEFIKKYENKIINIHPALLPAFPGTHGYEDAFNYGVKVSGCTVHFVDDGCDTGPIILQKVNPVLENDTPESFKKRGLKIEHEALPEAINLYCQRRLKVDGRKVKIIEKV